MKLLRSVVLLSAAALAGPAGCTEPPAPAPAPAEPASYALAVEVGPDGALRFATPEVFFDTVDALGRMQPAEVDAWERGLGFVSMRRAFEELAARLEHAAPDERAALLAANADLLEPDAEEPRLRVAASGYAAVVDRRGVMYVDGVAHKVTGTHVLTSRDGDPATIERHLATLGGALPRSASLAASPSAGGGDVDAFAYTGEAQLAACGASRSGTKTVGDRRETYYADAYIFKVVTSLGDRQYRYGADFTHYGYKKNLFGSWVSYGTTFQIYNHAFEMDGAMAIEFDGVRHRYITARYASALSYYTTSSDANAFTYRVFVGDTVQNVVEADLPAPGFHKIHHETTSRGTFPSRGILECRYCGDGTCSSAVGETASSCNSDCGYCGDGICSSSEAGWCSDCNTGPNCAIDPCTPQCELAGYACPLPDPS